MTCPYRFRFGTDGCEICQCRSSPCFNETAFLTNTECGQTTNGPKCPSTHDCVIAGRGGPPPSLSSRPPMPLEIRGVCCIHIDFEAIGITHPGSPIEY